MRRLLRSATILLAMTTATAARAQAPEGAPPVVPAATTSAPADVAAAFGQVRQIVVTGDAQVSFAHNSASGGGGSSNTLTLMPSASYFVVPNVSVGVGLLIQHGSNSFNTGVGSFSADVTTIGLILSGGYNLHLTPVLSMWAQLALGYAHTSTSSGNMSASGHTVPLGISVPFLYHPVEHFFFGLGPSFTTELSSSSSSKETSIGISSVVGGYFGT